MGKDLIVSVLIGLDLVGLVLIGYINIGLIIYVWEVKITCIHANTLLGQIHLKICARACEFIFFS